VVLEHLEGPRLSSLIRRHGRLEPEQLVPLGRQIAAALHYMAAEGVAHLDVKPANVIMGAPPRLIDLSIARPLADLAEVTARLGTVAYMAPEQVEPAERGPLTAAADVWGMGATLYHAAAGRPAFTAPRHRDDPPPQLDGAPDPLPDAVPAPAAELVMACLAPLPEDRPSPAEVAEGFEAIAAGMRRKPVLGRFRVRPR
jgi:serine/threonine protein kinase